MAEQTEGTTPRLPQVLRKWVQRGLEGVHVAMPGTVVAFDPVAQRAVVQPAVKAIDETTGETRRIPACGGVPVVFPSGGGYRMQWPLVPGDPVTLLFCSQSIEDWLANPSAAAATEPTEPSSRRRHSLSDAICLPGLRSFTNPLTPPRPLTLFIGSDALTLEFDNTQLLITLGGQTVAIEVNDALGRIRLGGLQSSVLVDDTASEVLVGDDLATSFIAKADLVLAAFGELITWANAHSHAALGGPPAPLLWPTGAPSVAATKGKVT